MRITEVNVNLRNEERLKAFVNITFDDVFVIRGLKVIEGQRGLFVCMPSRRLEDGSHRDIAHPITNEFRQEIEDEVLAAYDRLRTGQAPAEGRAEEESDSLR
ncbi:MAG: septation regulator SpoVG [bacterium]|jgi:stage V sporulation protein G|nr:septation regulator SpoVG [bacterium]